MQFEYRLTFFVCLKSQDHCVVKWDLRCLTKPGTAIASLGSPGTSCIWTTDNVVYVGSKCGKLCEIDLRKPDRSVAERQLPATIERIRIAGEALVIVTASPAVTLFEEGTLLDMAVITFQDRVRDAQLFGKQLVAVGANSQTFEIRVTK